MWYNSMVSQYPDNVGLKMGHANLLVCLGSYDQALKMYDRVIQLKANLVNVYTSKAMIYMYKQKDFAKAREIALKIKEFS